MFKPSPHPLFPPPTPDEERLILAQPDGERLLMDLHAKREERIKLAREIPLLYVIPLWIWKKALEYIHKMSLVYIAGGNRASKSYFAAWLVLLACRVYPGTKIFVMQASLDTSKHLQQELIWQLMHPDDKRLNQVNKPQQFYIKYGPANGFSEQQIYFPNGSMIKFLAYNQEPGGYEGWALGANLDELQRKGLFDPNNPPKIPGTDIPVPNMGYWCDENLTLDWYELLQLRVATNYAKGLWTFTPVDGITPTIKQMLGSNPETVEHQYAECVADQVNVPGLPQGHMPIVQIPRITPNAAAVFFWSEFNPFSGYEDRRDPTTGQIIPGIKTRALARNVEYRHRRVYGWTQDTLTRAFPLFGDVNIVKPEHVPTEGTRFLAIDPAPGSRNWFFFYAIVAPNNWIYFYDEWPDYESHGPWAKPNSKQQKPDGDRGPAQNGKGWGTVHYKKQWLRMENGHSIMRRYVDPRAGRNAHITESGGTCIIDMMAKADYDEAGKLIAPSMRLVPALGIHREEGENLITRALEWDPSKSLDPISNAPKLYVSSKCKQLIGMFENFTGEGGEKGGWRDVADAVRYLMVMRPRYMDPNVPDSQPGGTY